MTGTRTRETTHAETVGAALARKDDARTPAELIRQYSADFAAVLPSHIRATTWVRLAQGALKKGKRLETGMFELEQAALNNPGVFLATLLDAARLGLDPGTDQYYLTPRKVKGRLEILGIVSYQGYIELMYRAGAIASVVAEVVRENDTYRYRRGIDEIPMHTFPSFAGQEVRGALKGVYAYARMKDGAVSRVIELGPDEIATIKKYSQGADSEYSPWVNHEAAMWLKSAVRQLQKWVPTSPEFRRELLRATAQAADVARAHDFPAPVNLDAQDIIEGDVGEIDMGAIGATEEWPPTATPPES
jgi:recombination protein RecT